MFVLYIWKSCRYYFRAFTCLSLWGNPCYYESIKKLCKQRQRKTVKSPDSNNFLHFEPLRIPFRVKGYSFEVDLYLINTDCPEYTICRQLVDKPLSEKDSWIVSD